MPKAVSKFHPNAAAYAIITYSQYRVYMDGLKRVNGESRTLREEYAALRQEWLDADHVFEDNEARKAKITRRSSNAEQESIAEDKISKATRRKREKIWEEREKVYHKKNGALVLKRAYLLRDVQQEEGEELIGLVRRCIRTGEPPDARYDTIEAFSSRFFNDKITIDPSTIPPSVLHSLHLFMTKTEARAQGSRANPAPNKPKAKSTAGRRTAVKLKTGGKKEVVTR